MRKLKARVEDLERINGGLLAINQGNSKIEKDVSRVDFLHGISPSSSFPYENEESVWLMVKSRLNKEMERGEQSQWLWCCLRPGYLKGSGKVFLPKGLKIRTSRMQWSLPKIVPLPVLTDRLCWSSVLPLTLVVHFLKTGEKRRKELVDMPSCARSYHVCCSKEAFHFERTTQKNELTLFFSCYFC